MRLGRAAIGTGVVLALSGCGASDRDQIAAKVRQLAQAVGSHDYVTICDQILAPALITRLAANGLQCEEAMSAGFQGVQRPVISIGKVSVRGASAVAITLTVAQGQQASLAAIELVKTGQGWRISSLGSPVTAANSR